MQVRLKDDVYDKELKAGHNHQADPIETGKRIVEQQSKQAISTNPQLSNRSVMNNAMKNVEEPIIAAVNMSALRKTLEERKRKAFHYPKGRTDPAHLVIPPDWSSFEDEELFVVHDTGKDDPNRLVILSSMFMLLKLLMGKTIAMDGTFRTRPKKWAQIFAIHVCINGRFVPSVAVLMAKRNRASYQTILEFLKDFMEDCFEKLWVPTLILTDFELAQRSAINSFFRGVLHKGCYFHFVQAIHRWLGKVNLEKSYESDVLFNEYISLFRALAFIPAKQVVDAFLQLVNFETENIARFGREANYPGITRFLAYFKTSWIAKEGENEVEQHPRFPIALWNHNEEALGGDPTTTCALESWHRSINSATSHKGHSMWKCLKLFKTEIGTISRVQSVQIESLATPERTERHAARQKLARLQEAITNFSVANSISGLTTIARALRNVEFAAAEEGRAAALATGGIGPQGTPRTTRSRKRRNA